MWHGIDGRKDSDGASPVIVDMSDAWDKERWREARRDEHDAAMTTASAAERVPCGRMDGPCSHTDVADAWTGQVARRHVSSGTLAGGLVGTGPEA